MNCERNKYIFEMARRHLLSFKGVDDHIINKHLNDWERHEPNSTSDLLYGMLKSVKNRQGMPNVIGDDDIDKLRPVFEGFIPEGILKKYGDNWREDWKKVFSTLQHSYTPARLMLNEKPKKAWEIFCKSVISASCFLSRFSDVEEFNRFIGQF